MTGQYPQSFKAIALATTLAAALGGCGAHVAESPNSHVEPLPTQTPATAPPSVSPDELGQSPRDVEPYSRPQEISPQLPENCRSFSITLARHAGKQILDPHHQPVYYAKNLGETNIGMGNTTQFKHVERDGSERKDYVYGAGKRSIRYHDGSRAVISAQPVGSLTRLKGKVCVVAALNGPA